MNIFEKSSPLPFTADAVYKWHTSPGAFGRLSPPWAPVSVVSGTPGDVSEGARLHLKLTGGGFRWNWKATHLPPIQGRQFQDVQLSGPFLAWKHTHRFEPESGGGCILTDHIEYRAPFGPLADLLLRPDFRRGFSFRHQRTLNDMTQHEKYAQRPRMTIAMTGATGTVGRALTAFLTSGGHTVIPISRRPPPNGGPGIVWDPAKGVLDAGALEGLDGVVHLAGAPVSERWTPAHKAMIRDSRVMGTRLLCETLARLNSPPKVLVSGSAIGIYGDRGDERLDETSSSGEGFLADVGREWEGHTKAASDAGIRVVTLRTGIVMTLDGGALPKLLPPFKAGVGGPAGNGKQWVSWIHLDDLIGLIHHALFEPISGALNGTAPNPVRQREQARILGKVLKRPSFIPLPKAAVKLLFGEMGEALILEGARVHPDAAIRSGYTFLHPTFEKAIRWELGRPQPE